MVEKEIAFQLFVVCIIPFITGDNVFERQPRGICVKEVKETNCNERFVDKYPELSRSFSNLSLADSYFYLFTSQSPEEAEFLHMCGGGLSPNSNFNPDKPTVIIAHGFISSPCYQTWPRDIKNEFLKRDAYNVIIVDWAWGNGVSLADSVENMRIAAAQLAVVIDNIKAQKGVTGDNFQLIGMSSGVQLVARAAKVTNVGRITALDPGPFYSHLTQEDVLTKNDAELVDVIHTGGGKCLPHISDFTQQGHSDFYLNGGSNQSIIECIQSGLEFLLRGDTLSGVWYFIPPFCWHLSSIRYFATTINPNGCQHWGTKCNSYEEYKLGKCGKCHENGPNCEIMGQDWNLSHNKNKKKAARYYLDITAPCPYCVLR